MMSYWIFLGVHITSVGWQELRKCHCCCWAW